MKQPDIYTVISGTNRPGSNTRKVARSFERRLREAGALHVNFIALEELPRDFAYTDAWETKSLEMLRIIDELLVPTTKFIFVMPEYNGGFPGILKAFIDSVPPSVFHYKKAALIGLSSGASGALRPMDQFTNVLNYLRVSVLYAKPKLSGIEHLLDSSGEVVEERASALLNTQAELILNF